MREARSGRSKTIATWLALLGGAFGLHRFYLYGLTDRWGWLLWLPTLLGAYGVERMQVLGQDDRLAWMLMPLLGLTLAGTMLTAIVYGLLPAVRWQALHDPAAKAPAWPALDVLGAVIALALGATALMASIAFMAQRYFEHAAAPPDTTSPTQSNSQRLPR